MARPAILLHKVPEYGLWQYPSRADHATSAHGFLKTLEKLCGKGDASVLETDHTSRVLVQGHEQEIQY